MRSDYWYEKKPVPESVKSRVRDLTKGEVSAVIKVAGSDINLLQVDGTVFETVFTENREYLYRGAFTAPPYENDYMNATNFLTEDGLAGFSVTNTGWLVSFFSNYPSGGFAHAVADIILERVQKIVCTVSEQNKKENKLFDLYVNQYGFREYVITTDDTEFFRELYGEDFASTFTAHYGTPFHVFLIGPGCVGERESVKRFDDYNEAKSYVEKTVKGEARK